MRNLELGSFQLCVFASWLSALCLWLGAYDFQPLAFALQPYLLPPFGFWIYLYKLNDL
jgi:hypothetical protein